MSITITCPEAPRLLGEVPCRHSPCSLGNRCDYCDDGVEILDEPENPAAEMILYNRDACTLFWAVGLLSSDEEVMCGSLTLGEIKEALAKVQECLDKEELRAPFQVEPAYREVEGTEERRIISLGVTDQDILDLLLRFRALLQYAEANSFSVVWG